MGQYGTLIQPFGYLSVSPPFSMVKMMNYTKVGFYYKDT